MPARDIVHRVNRRYRQLGQGFQGSRTESPCTIALPWWLVPSRSGTAVDLVLPRDQIPWFEWMVKRSLDGRDERKRENLDDLICRVNVWCTMSGSFVWLCGGACSSVANFDQHFGFSNRYLERRRSTGTSRMRILRTWQSRKSVFRSDGTRRGEFL